MLLEMSQTDVVGLRHYRFGANPEEYIAFGGFGFMNLVYKSSNHHFPPTFLERGKGSEKNC